MDSGTAGSDQDALVWELRVFEDQLGSITSSYQSFNAANKAEQKLVRTDYKISGRLVRAVKRLLKAQNGGNAVSGFQTISFQDKDIHDAEGLIDNLLKQHISQMQGKYHAWKNLDHIDSVANTPAKS